MNRLILTDISQLVAVGGKAPKRGKDMDHLEFIEKGCVVVDDGIIVFVGTMEAYNLWQKNKDDLKGSGEKALEKNRIEKNKTDPIETRRINCKGKTVLPGFIDSHTHFIFAGYREDEFRMRLAGEKYMDILNKGGGIIRSVTETRQASLKDLIQSGGDRLQGMLEMGVTCVEGKSGYGLDLDTELKQLQAMKVLNETQPVEIVPTFLGPHSVPPEYKGKQAEYLEYILKEVLPQVKKAGLAEFADIFCEKGVFSVEEARTYLSKARDMGFKLKIHADEIVSLGGTELAVELGCISGDHLLAASHKGIKDLSKGQTMATLLPATAFGLNEPFAKARDMIDQGCCVALASDFNPGSCPTYSIPLIIALAALRMKMTTKEIVSSLTINGACAVGREKRIGSISLGKQGDLIILNKPTIDFLPYHMAVNLVEKVVKKGIVVVDKKPEEKLPCG